MSTMFRVVVPNGGPPVVSTGAVTFGVCGATEVAVIVGDTVPRQRCGTELREMMRAWARNPKGKDTGVGAGNKKTYVSAPGVPGEQIASAVVANAIAPTETQWGIVVGETAAIELCCSDVLFAALERTVNAITATLGNG